MTEYVVEYEENFTNGKLIIPIKGGKTIFPNIDEAVSKFMEYVYSNLDFILKNSEGDALSEVLVFAKSPQTINKNNIIHGINKSGICFVRTANMNKIIEIKLFKNK